MKVLGYIVVFGGLCFMAYMVAANAPSYNIQMGIGCGILIPIVMLLMAEISEDL